MIQDKDDTFLDKDWTFHESDDPYLHSTNSDIHAINICSFDPFDMGIPDINLDPEEHTLTKTCIYDPSVKTPFDLWLHQNHDPPELLFTTHRKLLDDLASDPVSITHVATLQDAHIQQLHQFDYDGPRVHYDVGSQASMTHSKHHLHCYREFPPHSPCTLRLVAVDGKRYCCLPDPGTSTGYRDILMYYMPDTPMTIISPSSIL
jgi:hypothetical protein